jgi:DNA repair protein RecN (Recombination protein N)
LDVLDQWAGAEVMELAREYRGAYERAWDASRRLAESHRNEQARAREIELLRFQVGELGQAQLSVDEEASLEAEQRLLSRAEDILQNTALAAAGLRSDGDGAGDEPDASGLVGQAIGHLTPLTGVDPALDRVISALADAEYQLIDLARELHGYADRVLVDPGRLEAVNARLRLYTDLARKYGGTTGAAVTRLTEARERLESLEFGEEDLVRLEEARAAQAARALALAGRLTEQRKRSAPRLQEAIAGELADLGMPSATLKVDIRTREGWEGLRETGADAVEFLLVANPGQEPRSLAKTASGGELSRVLLGIKCALAGVGGNETLVFDEIDAGIGGRTAVAVANKLRELSQIAQAVVITHLAQVAALAQCHYVIEKVSDPAVTVTRLRKIAGDQLVEELCRMLGGRPDDSEAMAHARQLRDRAASGLLD